MGQCITNGCQEKKLLLAMGFGDGSVCCSKWVQQIFSWITFWRKRPSLGVGLRQDPTYRKLIKASKTRTPCLQCELLIPVYLQAGEKVISDHGGDITFVCKTDVINLPNVTIIIVREISEGSTYLEFLQTRARISLFFLEVFLFFSFYFLTAEIDKIADVNYFPYWDLSIKLL